MTCPCRKDKHGRHSNHWPAGSLKSCWPRTGEGKFPARPSALWATPQAALACVLGQLSQHLPPEAVLIRLPQQSQGWWFSFLKVRLTVSLATIPSKPALTLRGRPSVGDIRWLPGQLCSCLHSFASVSTRFSKTMALMLCLQREAHILSLVPTWKQSH